MAKKIISWEHVDYPFERVDENLNLVKNNLTIFPNKEEDEEQEEVEVPILMETPRGIFALDDRLNPYRNYEIRIGDTNFELSDDISNVIAKEEGVEFYEKLGRYKFMIAIGKLFDFSIVRRNLEIKLCNYSENDFKLAAIADTSIKNNISKLIESFGKNKYVIYLFPNGNLEFIDETDLKFKEELNNLKKCEGLSNGIVFTNS